MFTPIFCIKGILYFLLIASQWRLVALYLLSLHQRIDMGIQFETIYALHLYCLCYIKKTSRQNIKSPKPYPHPPCLYWFKLPNMLEAFHILPGTSRADLFPLPFCTCLQAAAHEQCSTALLFPVLTGRNHYIPLQSANHQLILFEIPRE